MLRLTRGASWEQVTDPSGAVLGGATVTLTNEGTGCHSLDHGRQRRRLQIYAGPNRKLQDHGYLARVPDHGTEKHRGQRRRDAWWSNFTLKPGQVTETVEVTTTTPVLETQDASVGQVVNTRNVNNLPLNGRNFTFLAQLAAGVNSPQADTRGNAASGAFAANGFASGAEQLPAGWNRQQLRHRRLPERHELCCPSSGGCDSGIQGTDHGLQRRVSDAPAPRFSTPPSSPAPTAFHGAAGNFSATTSSMPPTISKTSATSQKGRTSAEPVRCFASADR